LINMNEGLISRLHAEVRKLGIGLTLVTQSPSLLNQSIITNTNVKIVHALKSREDIELMSRSLGISRDLALTITRLDVGEALIDFTGLPSPLPVRVGFKKSEKV